jgi:hypothetical protein
LRLSKWRLVKPESRFLFFIHTGTPRMVGSYTLGMNPLRTVPLFDSGAQPASWNERMSPGEYAVHYSSFDSSALVTGPSCTILGSLADAEEYAKAQVLLKPGLRCRIYDDRGFVGPPILEVRGQQYKGESEISPRFRRWVGSLLFFGGLVLVIVDWSVDFKLTWPATIGMRVLIPGLILLVTEVILVLNVKHKRIHEEVRKSV